MATCRGRQKCPALPASAGCNKSRTEEFKGTLSLVGNQASSAKVEGCLTARPIGLAVKPPSAFTLKSPIADRAEVTFELLRYSLGGDRPSQTAHLALSTARVHGTELEFKHNKGGVSSCGSTSTGVPVSQPPTYTTHAGPKPNTKLQ